MRYGKSGRYFWAGEEIAQRHAKAQLAILFHPGDKLLDAPDVIVSVPAAKAVQRRFQHHHFRERDNGHQIIAIGVVSAFCNCCSSAIALSTPS